MKKGERNNIGRSKGPHQANNKLVTQLEKYTPFKGEKASAGEERKRLHFYAP